MKIGFCMSRAAWPAVALGLLLTGCAPSYYLSIRPSEAAEKGPDGPQTLFAALDSIEMTVRFAHQRDKELLFEAEIRNGSGRAVLVDPAQFYYQPALAQGVASTANAAYGPSRIAAFDPELKVEQLATKLSTADRKATGTSVWEWLTMLSDVTADVTATKRKETPKQEYERKVQYDQSMQSFDDTRARHAETADRTALELELWQRKMLRRYLLQPGELMHGYIVFPALDQSALLRLSTPIGPHNFTFDFEQQRKQY
ncbi:hypothetical protein SAMN02745146_1916 [Hymenobacter daecheongensis DSM 21074]|uniref:Uncharacterized protein n=1 Tax=Hymenobacter daecheongensis DSM 21074 TaxID=1121955 RepID=A0A1M6F2W2_9BACT|nr:hypothetical protein [Hymenobacter daecheongensis]SHI92013.1 hypothetical protein SAMN02745146_1916 [Hymenobacter daecheongensis DSM 21074]